MIDQKTSTAAGASICACIDFPSLFGGKVGGSPLLSNHTSLRPRVLEHFSEARRVRIAARQHDDGILIRRDLARQHRCQCRRPAGFEHQAQMRKGKALCRTNFLLGYARPFGHARAQHIEIDRAGSEGLQRVAGGGWRLIDRLDRAAFEAAADIVPPLGFGNRDDAVGAGEGESGG